VAALTTSGTGVLQYKYALINVIFQELKMNNLTIENSLSDGLSVIAKNAGEKIGVLSNTALKKIKILTYGIGAKGKHGLWISSEANGGLSLTKSHISEIRNESKNFSIH
jgi:hypothetical protein